MYIFTLRYLALPVAGAADGTLVVGLGVTVVVVVIVGVGVGVVVCANVIVTTANNDRPNTPAAMPAFLIILSPPFKSLDLNITVYQSNEKELFSYKKDKLRLLFGCYEIFKLY